jgi:hypothetical protein
MKDEDPDHVRGSWKNKSNWHPKIRWSPEPGPKWKAEFCSWAPDASFLPQGYARGPWSAAEWEASNASLNVDAMRSLWSLIAMADSPRAAQPKARWSDLQICLGKKLGVHTNGVDLRSSNYNLLSRIFSNWIPHGQSSSSSLTIDYLGRLTAEPVSHLSILQSWRELQLQLLPKIYSPGFKTAPVGSEEDSDTQAATPSSN